MVKVVAVWFIKVRESIGESLFTIFVSLAKAIRSVLAKLQNSTRPLISISLNKNSNYCYTSASRKVVLQTGKSYATMLQVIMGNGGLYGCLTEP